MTSESENMLRKIKALLAKAEGQGVTPEEAESFSAKAVELMQKYSITMAVVDAARSKDDREKPIHEVVDFRQEQYALHKLILINAIALNGRCDGYRTQSDSYTIFGFRSDVDLALTLYYSLLVQAQRALARTPVPPGVRSRTFRVAWWIGYTSRLSERLKKAKVKAEDEAPGTELVLADRSLAVRNALRNSGVKTSTTAVHRKFYKDTGGFEEGTAAANRADLDGTRIDSRSAAGALT